MKKLFLTLAVVLASVFSINAQSTYRIYAYLNGLDWANPYVYMYGGAGELFGPWSGSAANGIETINNLDYFYFDVPDAGNGKTASLVFSNAGTKSLPDFGGYSITANLYVQLDPFGVTVINDPQTYDPVPVEAAEFTIYVDNQTSWEQVYLYLYGQRNSLGGSWPGMQPKGSETFNGTEFLAFTFTAEEGLQEKAQFHNGKPANNGQAILNDLPITITQNMFVRITDSGAQLLDAMDYMEFKVYAHLNGLDWENPTLYMFGEVGNLGGSWPGFAPSGTVTINDVEYYTFDIPTEGNGKKENLIFSNGGPNSLPTYQNYVINADLYLELDALGALVIEDPQTFVPAEPPVVTEFTVYVDNQTSWNQVYMYLFGERDGLGGSWPGISSSGTVTMQGTEFLTFTFMAVEGLDERAIFNNGQNNGQTEDKQLSPIPLMIAEHMFVRITDAGAEQLDAMDYLEYKVYAHLNGLDWENPTLYMFGNVNDLGGSWPGFAPSGTTTVNDVEYYCFDIPAAGNGKTEQLIFSNRGQNQLPTYSGYVIDADLYLELDELGVTKIDNPETYVPGEPPVTTDFTFYVENNTSWDEIWMYLFGDRNGLGGAWPGMQAAGNETIKGTDFLVFTVKGVEGLNERAIFNNGNGNGKQLDPLPLTLDTEIIYISIDDTEAVLLDPNDFLPEYKVYAHLNGLEWSDPTLYMYGSDGEPLGVWPGEAAAGTETINDVEYYYFNLPSDCNDLTYNLIFSNNREDKLPDYQNCTISSDLYFELDELGVTLIEDPETYEPGEPPVVAEFTIYVDNQTSWDDVYMYLYGDRNGLGGTWPGIAASGSQTFKGTDFLTFTFKGAEGLEERAIFNNGQSGDDNVQLSPLELTITQDIFIRITDEEAELLDSEIYLKPEYKVYAHLNGLDWDMTTLYLYGEVDGLGGEWPGISAAGTETINDVEYVFFNIPDSGNGLTENLIFSNNGNNQIPDFFDFTISSDLYVELTVLGVTQIEDPLTYEPGEPPAMGQFTVYVDNKTSWDAVYMYIYGDLDKLAGSWPGMAQTGSQTLEGRDFITFTFEAPVGLAENLIFNDNAGSQLEAIPYTLTDDLYVEITDEEATLLDPDNLSPEPEPEPEPDLSGYLLYVRGTMNEWRPDGDWALTRSEKNDNLYTGSFTIAGGEVSFKIADSSWGEYNFGGAAPIDLDVYSNVASQVTLTNQSQLSEGVTQNITILNWGGGTMKLSFNLQTQMLVIEGPDQPTTDQEVSVGMNIADGTLHYVNETVYAPAPTLINVYNIAGTMVATGAGDTLYIGNLGSGIYFIKAQGYPDLKIMK